MGPPCVIDLFREVIANEDFSEVAPLVESTKVQVSESFGWCWGGAGACVCAYWKSPGCWKLWVCVTGVSF